MFQNRGRLEGASGSYLGHQTLEKTGEAFISGHVGKNSETTLGVVKVSVLNSSLDDIERRGDDKRGRGTSNGSNKVLEPGGLVVVFQVEDVLLGECRTTEQLDTQVSNRIRQFMSRNGRIRRMNQGRFWQQSSPNHGIVRNLHHQ